MLVIKGDLKWVTGRTILKLSRFSMILNCMKTFADTTVLSLTKRISTKTQVVLGELSRTETVIRNRFVKNLINGETK
jgi:hypothetical protein|tara:strand:+ start:323 stop:553 length:231 start_codon:yes stop_codon:yes gene_type:complete